MTEEEVEGESSMTPLDENNTLFLGGKGEETEYLT